MKVLVACEFSGVVRRAFAARGHDAWSCDLLPAEDGGPHIRGDVRTILDRGWDLLIGHPPCTDLASSGAQYWPAKRADGRQISALGFVLALAGADIPRIVIENPVGILSSVWRKPDQIIQPTMFGEPYLKKTCLWLKGLPPLVATNPVAAVAAWGTNSKYGGRRKDGSRKLNDLPVMHADGHSRSRSFPGIAAAMADQWGGVPLESRAA